MAEDHGRAKALSSRRQTGRIAALLAVGAMLTGCNPPGERECPTRDTLIGEMEVIREVEAQRVEGEIWREDPGNWWTGLKKTGERCDATISHKGSGTWIETSMLEEPIRLTARLGENDSPFFTGKVDEERTVVVQHHRGKVVDISIVGYDEDGVLNYGGCGARDGIVQECLIGRTRE